MKLQPSTLIAMLAGMAALAPAARAQNPHFDAGDLVLFFQKPGSDNTVYVGLGNAATLYRGDEAGPTANRQALNIVNINATLTAAFGAGWPADPAIFAGLAACRSSSSSTTLMFDGDPARTLYASQARQSLGTIGSAASEAWDFTTSGFSGPSTNIVAMNHKLETDHTTRAAVSPVSVSNIDDQNPIELAPDGSFLQPSAFNSFPGGVQQQGSASTFGVFGPAGQVEFALDLYRILSRTTVAGQVAGPDKTGSFEGTVVVSTSGNVSFITQASIPTPEIDVEQPAGSDIADGAGVGFGSTAIGSTGAARTFVIRNNGDAELTGLALSIGGAHSGDFIVSDLAETSLASGSFTTFTVSFNPQAAGVRSATLQIASNDADENPYDILLSGTGVIPSPEISIRNAAGTELVDGKAKTNFGSVAVGWSSPSQTFTIRNLGNAALTGLAISKSGSHAADFTVTPLAASTLAPGKTMTFKVTYSPKAKGARAAAIHIASNDADENPFDIQLAGTAFTPAPEIDIQQKKGSSLVDGKSKVSFGTVKVGKTGAARVFTIRNVGTANLTGLAVSNSGGNSKDFILTKPGKTTLAPGASTTFKISLKPSATGTRKTTLRVKSNDADENPFDITLTGVGAKK